MSECVKYITAGIAKNCKSQIQKGVEHTGWIANRDHIDLVNSKVVGSKITALEFNDNAPEKPLFPIVIAGKTPFNGLKSSLVVGAYSNTWDKEAPIIILDSGVEVVENVINPLTDAESSFILVVENKGKGENGNNAFEVFGFDQGLVASAGENDKWNDETNGGWKITLSEKSAAHAALFLEPTVEEATGAAVTKKFIESKAWTKPTENA